MVTLFFNFCTNVHTCMYVSVWGDGVIYDLSNVHNRESYIYSYFVWWKKCLSFSSPERSPKDLMSNPRRQCPRRSRPWRRRSHLH